VFHFFSPTLLCCRGHPGGASPGGGLLRRWIRRIRPRDGGSSQGPVNGLGRWEGAPSPGGRRFRCQRRGGGRGRATTAAGVEAKARGCRCARPLRGRGRGRVGPARAATRPVEDAELGDLDLDPAKRSAKGRVRGRRTMKPPQRLLRRRRPSLGGGKPEFISFHQIHPEHGLKRGHFFTPSASSPLLERCLAGAPGGHNGRD
jgi:hypothetical protein